jgi:hypothetical protein
MCGIAKQWAEVDHSAYPHKNQQWEQFGADTGIVQRLEQAMFGGHA